MSSYNRRYAILQDKNLKSSEVESVKSVTTPPTVSGVNQSTKTDMYGEGSLEPSVSKSVGSSGDVSIVATGSVNPTYEEDTENASTYSYEAGINPRKTSGTGLIQTDGASSRSRFSYKLDSEANYQFRTTPNYFSKVPFTLAYDVNTSYSGKAQCYSRPELLSLKNGNLLCAYLDSFSPPWMWSFSSNLLDSSLATSVHSFTTDAYNGASRTVTVSVATWDGTKIVVNALVSQNAGSSNPSYYRIVEVDSVSRQFVLEDKRDGVSWSTGASNVLDVPTFSNRPSSTNTNNVKLRLSLNQDKYWSEENSTYPLSNDSNFGSTGISLVQFDDTEEVLLVSCGYIGDASDAVNNSSYLHVDEIKSTLDSYSGFTDGIDDASYIERRSSVGLNKYDGFFSNDETTDVSNLDNQTIPLAMTAETLPSGRLVVVIAFSDKLVSLTSDDRGVTFGATEIMDLQFGSDYEYQQFCSLDSVVDSSGKIVILLTANPIGERGYSSAVPASSDPIKQSVVSVFVSMDGNEWSSEKRLGGGSYYPQYGSISYTGTYPSTYAVHIDESVYPLSGSICLTPEGGYLVSLVTLNLGGPGNSQGCHVYQRVLSVDEISFGSTGIEIAPSLPAQIYSTAQPVEAAISRFGMAVPYFGGRRDNPYSDFPALLDYLNYAYTSVTSGTSPSYRNTAPHDRGYLGALYFAGIRNFGEETLVYKRMGGGPIVVNGPIDISTCLHQGEIVTAVCEGFESETSDSPGSNEYLQQRNINKDTLVRGVNIFFSDSMQPLRVNLPTEIRRYEASYDVAGRLNEQKYDEGPVAQNLELFNGRIFDDNPFQASQNSVANSHIDVQYSNQAASLNVTGVDRFITFTVIGNSGWEEGPTFRVTNVTSNQADGKVRFNITSIDGSVVDNIYDGYPYSITRSPDVVATSDYENGMVFGANSYQVSLMGAKNPQYWGWQRSASAGANGSIEEDAESGVSYATKWELNLAANQYVNYSFDKDYNQNEVYGKFTFPNTDGEALKSTYPATRNALSFVQRSVFQIQSGGNRRNSNTVTTGSTLDYALRCSSQVFLRDTGDGSRASGNFLSMGLCISRVGSSVYLRLMEIYWNGSATEYSPVGDEIVFSDNGTGANLSEKVPFYEVVWGVKPVSSTSLTDNYTPFLYARPWNRYSDPGFLQDFSKPSAASMSPVASRDLDPFGGNVASSTVAEYVGYGVYDTTIDTSGVRVSFQSVQFSRSFLNAEPCFAIDYEEGELDSGLFEFREDLHVPKEPAMDFLRLYNAGQMSPMSPARCSTFPQMIDNGIELSFRGRSTGQDTFSYEGRSTFPALAALDAPVKDGWRSPTEEITFSVPSENGVDNVQTARVPSYEIIYDAGSNSINPESVSLFGINTGSAIIDFNDISSFGAYGTVSQPELTMLFCSPGHTNSLLFNYWANSLIELNTPPLSPSLNDKYLVGTSPTGAWSGQAGKVATWSGVVWSFLNVFPGYTARDAATGLRIYDGSAWQDYYDEQPRIFFKPTYLMYFQYRGLRENIEDGIPDSRIRWFMDPDNPTTVVFKTDLSTSDMNPRYAPFRPGQFKSQSNENFYLLVVDKSASPTLFSYEDFSPSELRSNSDVKYSYYYKIVDNGTDYLTLDRSITDVFRDDESEASSAGKLTAGSMTIISDRVAANTPDFFDSLGTNSLKRGTRYRYMRITLSGGDHSDDFLKLGVSICGQRLDLSNPDFSLSYSYSMESGSSLFDSLSGRRRSRRNHKPRKSWDVSYEPRPSAELDIVYNTQNTSTINTRRGYGNVDDHWVNPAQSQEIQKLSWQELIERVLSIGINGDVLALGFDGNNMQTLSGTEINLTPRETFAMADLKPSLSNPHGLCVARLTGYDGAQNVAYTWQREIANSQGGAGSFSGTPAETKNQTECTPAAVMQIKGLKFSEEL